MELKVYKDTVTAARSICDTKAELPVETELLIPDYLPQVFKIVKCFVTPVVLQKQALTGRLSLEGYLRCVVFYQAEEAGSLCQTEQKLPFTKQLELNGDAQGAVSVQAGGEAEYINCRALSGRRVDVRGAFLLHVRAWACQDSEVVTALAGADVQQRTVVLAGSKPVGQAEKMVTLQQPVPFDGEPAAVLNCQCAPQVEEVKLLAGKAVVRGQVHTDITYRTGPGRALLHQFVSVPFQEVVQIDGAAEDCRGWAWLEPAGCTLTQAEDAAGGQGITLAVTALLEVSVWRDVETVAVADAFSTSQELEPAPGEVALEQAGDPFTRTVEATAEGAMPDAQARVLDAFATPLPPELVDGEDGCAVLRGRAVVHVLCENETGEVDCYDKTCEYTLPAGLDAPAAALTARCTAAVQQVTARRTGDGLAAGVTLTVSGVIGRIAAATVLCGAVCTGPRERTDGDIALRICFAGPGEQLFAIAKHYGASPSAIAAANGLEGDTLTQPCQLLIPRAQ